MALEGIELRKKLNIQEIFGPTIQGEGPYTGRISVFIRLAGCDFNCIWCDTKEAQSIAQATQMDAEEIVEVVRQVIGYPKLSSYESNFLVVLTGGNPCLQDCTELVMALKSAFGCDIQVETQGSVLPAWLSMVDKVVISPKGENACIDEKWDIDAYHRVLYAAINAGHIHREDIVFKFVIGHETRRIMLADLSFAAIYLNSLSPFSIYQNTPVYLNMCTREDWSQQDMQLQYSYFVKYVLQEFSMCDTLTIEVLKRFNILLGCQVHVLVWGHKKGV